MKNYFKKTINKVLKEFGYKIVSATLPPAVGKEREKKEKAKNQSTKPSSYAKTASLPKEAASYLSFSNERFQSLSKHYDEFDNRVTTPLIWKPDILSKEDLLYFRGDNAYVWQVRGRNVESTSYGLSYYYLKAIDDLGLLSRLEEDHMFGNYTFEIDNKLVSRDLIDSCLEIYFLNKHLPCESFKGLNLLDIGAGYGRLAYRLTAAFPDIGSYLCTDAVAQSTFISEYYLSFRKAEKARVVPLTDIEAELSVNKVDVAVNIHSFSECQLDAIEWWLRLLRESSVRYLMIAPNAMGHGGNKLLTSGEKDFLPLLKEYGYSLLVKESKYKDSFVQKNGMNPTHYYLFELDNYKNKWGCLR